LNIIFCNTLYIRSQDTAARTLLFWGVPSRFAHKTKIICVKNFNQTHSLWQTLCPKRSGR